MAYVSAAVTGSIIPPRVHFAVKQCDCNANTETIYTICLIDALAEASYDVRYL